MKTKVEHGMGACVMGVAYRLKRILAAGLIALFLAAGGALPVQAEESPPLLAAAQAILQAALDRLDQHAADAAGELTDRELDSMGAGRVLRWLRSAEPQVIVAATVDAKGVMVLTEPAEYRGHEGADLSAQPQVARALSQGKPALSRLMRMVEGYWAVDLERPIRLPSGGMAGLLSATFHPAPLADSELGRLPGGVAGGLFLLQDDGVVLYSPRHEEIGLELAAAVRVKADPARRALLDKILAQPQGSAMGPGLMPGHSAPGDMPIDWVPLGLHGTQWRLCLTGAR